MQPHEQIFSKLGTHNFRRAEAFHVFDSSWLHERRVRVKRRQREHRSRHSWWDKNLCQFDENNFICAAILRGKLSWLLSRPQSVQLHVPKTLPLELPPAVVLFLSKSDKLIPTKGPPTWSGFFRCC